MPTKIDWANETINPLGHWCFGPNGTKDKPNICPYCYAARMAKRNMTGCENCQTFNTPHTHFEQLEKLTQWKKPRNVFIQSMGDLFHSEVSDEWIKEIFAACEAAPQHRYLFLTKNPKRYIELAEKEILPMKDNYWYGSTATAENETFWWSKRHNAFVSIEPILSEFAHVDEPVKKVDWVIIGAESGNRKGKVIPKREWLENIVENCRATGTPVFMKSSLAKIWGEPLIQEYPWEVKRND